ncbi:MAG TPA: IgGFc-binding protein, partial [Candidatus Kapabacteria bacterium]|nr:IgGFc-binding protein [Candidatus Kapabacteria bacterium]
MKKVLCCLFLVCFTLAHAQSGVGLHGLSATDGKDYYLGWLFPSLNDQDLSSLGSRSPLPFFGVYILVSSYSDNQFTVSYFDDKTGQELVSSSYQIAKRRSLIVPIDRVRMRMDGGGKNGYEGEVAQWRSMHVTSKKPINVQFFSSGACSGGSYLGLPVNMLGKEYVIESYNDNPGEGGFLSHEHSAGYFMVIAAFDSTKITITPNSTTALGHVGATTGIGATGTPKPFMIFLRRGQCYMVKSSGAQSSYDISGTTILSDKPVSVIAGHENANIQGSSVGIYNHLDARDFMIEQMIPVEFWDTTGYISIPFVDATNANGGAGDEYRAFYGKLASASANYPSETSVQMKPDNAPITLKPFPLPVAAKKGVTTPVSFSSANGCKFHVVQYDQRMQGTAPDPCPSQMSIIPMSQWKTSYLWYVASNVTPQEVYQAYYINLICYREDYDNGTLQWAISASPLAPVKSGVTIDGIKSIPDHPELMGVTIKLTAPNSYYVVSTSNRPFIIYNYGYRAIDAARNLSGNNESNFYFSYASPVGFATPGFDTSFFTITVTPTCSRWDMCIAVGGSNKPKLRSIILLNDKDKDVVDKPNSDTGYVSSNVRFDNTLDPDGHGEIDLSGSDSSTCVQLFVKNPADSAYAAVLIVDDKGNYRVVELKYAPSPLNDTIRGASFDIAKSPWYLVDAAQGYHRDSLLFPITKVGTSNCATIFYACHGDSSVGTPASFITGAMLGGADGSFTL